MKPYHLVFCGLVRNAEVNLRFNLERIEAIRTHFKKVSVLIFENDSFDQTKQVLQDYAARAEGVSVTVADYAQDPLGRGPYSRHRIDLMSQYRNQYLHALKELEEVDYVCVIDLDIFHFDVARFLACFEGDKPWDVRSAFGINRVEYMWDYVFYDIYAYTDVGDYRVLPFYNFKEFKSRQRELYRTCKQAPGLVPVGSNFNGLALYRAEALLCGAAYSSAEAKVEGVESLCEHVVLHAALRERGYTEQYLDPNLVVTYLNISRWNHLKKYLPFQALRHMRRIYGALRKASSKARGSKPDAAAKR
jgi:hypothetical protein